MHGLADQHQRMKDFTAPFTVLRLLTPLGMTYVEAKKRAAPYDKIVGELPEMRSERVDLVRQAVSRRIRAYVLVNNRTEGHAPLTVQGLVDLLEASGTEPESRLDVLSSTIASQTGQAFRMTSATCPGMNSF
jgi:uncharacterized protein YecE (DUF72 family)